MHYFVTFEFLPFVLFVVKQKFKSHHKGPKVLHEGHKVFN